MADNTPNDTQWWAKVDIKTWVALISVFFLVSGGVESIKSSVVRIEKLQSEMVEFQKKTEERVRTLEDSDMRQNFEIERLKKIVDEKYNN